jgi:hypothetical protein
VARFPYRPGAGPKAIKNPVYWNRVELQESKARASGAGIGAGGILLAVLAFIYLPWLLLLLAPFVLLFAGFELYEKYSPRAKREREAGRWLVIPSERCRGNLTFSWHS